MRVHCCGVEFDGTRWRAEPVRVPLLFAHGRGPLPLHRLANQLRRCRQRGEDCRARDRPRAVAGRHVGRDASHVSILAVDDRRGGDDAVFVLEALKIVVGEAEPDSRRQLLPLAPADVPVAGEMRFQVFVLGDPRRPASPHDALVRIPHDAGRGHGAEPYLGQTDLPAVQAAADGEGLDTGVFEIGAGMTHDVDEARREKELDSLLALERPPARALAAVGNRVLEQRDGGTDHQRGDDPCGTLHPEAGRPVLP